MLLIQNKLVTREMCQIGIPGATAKDKENRCIPFNRGTARGDPQTSIDTRTRIRGYSERRLALTNRISRPLGKHSGCSRMASSQGPADISPSGTATSSSGSDLRWHHLRHEGACRLLADGLDIRIIQLMLGHASIQQTQRYPNVTDEELRRGLEVS